MQHSTSTERRPMTRPTKVALAVGLSLLALLIMAPTTAVADTASDLADAQRLLRQCQLDYQYATSTAERTRAQQCITIKQKVIAGLRATPTPTGNPTSSPTATPTATPTVPPTPTPTVTTPNPTPTPTATTTPPTGTWPNATNRGVPANWTPSTTRSGFTITAPGTYTDILVNGTLNIAASNVTLRRVKVVGGIINNRVNGVCYNGLLMEDVTVTRAGSTTANDYGNDGAIGVGGYTARRVAILDIKEGFRIGGYQDANCGPVVIEDSFARATSPTPCGDWHGDALQGYDANTLTIRHSTLVLQENGCGGTGAFFYPLGQRPFTVDGLLVQGGGYVFRTDTQAVVSGLMVVDGSWTWGPVDWSVTCPRVPTLSAQIVRLDSQGQPTTVVRTQSCPS